MYKRQLWDNVIDPLANWLLSTFGPVFTQVFNSVAGIVTNAIGIVADGLEMCIRDRERTDPHDRMDERDPG